LHFLSEEELGMFEALPVSVVVVVVLLLLHCSSGF
jgi:hypothetical protein